MIHIPFFILLPPWFLVRPSSSLSHSVGEPKRSLYSASTMASDESHYCIGIHDQPAFSHPLLKNHTIQKSLTGTRAKSEWPTYEAHVSKVKCPVDTIPVQIVTALDHRAKPQTGTINRSYQHEYATVATDRLEKLYGTIATINVWEPVVENSGELSLAQMWITSGDCETKDLNTIEVGWQVCEVFYKDNKPRLFIYWTSDTYNTTGGYNLHDPGFVQTSSEVVLGGAISPLSSIGGRRQFEITILVWKDPRSGNWWLRVGTDLAGYWPRELFTTLGDHAGKIDWGGEIIDSESFGRHTKTQMGSGRFPQEGFGNASYFRNIQVVDHTCNFQPTPELFTHADTPYYDIKNLHRDELGTHFFFGGPGFGHRHSGVVSLSLSQFFLYLCFSFFIIIII
ncbi:PREDICTED: uncharacterized protein LOC104699414 [Camelina sativa]|uniref:Uncharacterized protein LOC104699414 n=1 Tax=Camelina sativa TaxID=90675 RepID=A0ABM0SLJ8_CAMSA|nr:PREDICTED: uncharacterized protein LOC104699414 [Camelina sativa]